MTRESLKYYVLRPSVCYLTDPNFLCSQSQTLTRKLAPDEGFPLRRFTEIHPEAGTKSLDHHPTPSRLLETHSTINKRRSWFFLGVQLGLLCTSEMIMIVLGSIWPGTVFSVDRGGPLVDVSTPWLQSSRGCSYWHSQFFFPDLFKRPCFTLGCFLIRMSMSRWVGESPQKASATTQGL